MEIKAIEIVEDLPTNVLDIRTGRPIVFAEPVEVEMIFVRTCCHLCGQVFWWARVAGKPGRQRRFCSAECRAERHHVHVRNWRWKAATAGMDDLFSTQPLELRNDG